VSVAKVVRAVIGIVVVFALGVVVMNQWNDFKTARSNMPATPTTSAGDTSSTATSTVLGVGVAKINGVNFRVKPSSSAALIRGLKKGEKVTILLKDGQWYRVKDSKGKLGWVTANGDYVALQAK